MLFDPLNKLNVKLFTFVHSVYKFTHHFLNKKIAISLLHWQGHVVMHVSLIFLCNVIFNTCSETKYSVGQIKFKLQPDVT